MSDFIDFIAFQPKKSKGSHKNVSACTIYPQKLSCIAKVNKHSEDTIYHFIKDLPIASITPKFYGLYDEPIFRDCPESSKKTSSDDEDDGDGYLILENLLIGFKKPNTIDIKLGTRMFDIRTKKTSVKKLSKAVDESTSHDYGFRISEVQTYKDIKSPNDEEPWPTKQNKFKKAVQKELENNIAKVKEFFKAFFSFHQLNQFFSELKEIRNVLIVNLRQFPKFRMYASSLFVAYDNDAPEDSEVRTKLIDLAHAHFDVDSDGGNSNSLEFDDGIIRGIDSLISIIGLIINGYPKQIGDGTKKKDGKKESKKNKQDKIENLEKATKSENNQKEEFKKANDDKKPAVEITAKTDAPKVGKMEATKGSMTDIPYQTKAEPTKETKADTADEVKADTIKETKTDTTYDVKVDTIETGLDQAKEVKTDTIVEKLDQTKEATTEATIETKLDQTNEVSTAPTLEIQLNAAREVQAIEEKPSQTKINDTEEPIPDATKETDLPKSIKTDANTETEIQPTEDSASSIDT